MMGNIRTPRLICKNGLVMNFNVDNNKVFYKISKWNDDGDILVLLQSGELKGQDPQKIMDQASQNFTECNV